MKKHLHILFALTATTCLVNANTDSQPKPHQQPKNSTDGASPTTHGEGVGGSTGVGGNNRGGVPPTGGLSGVLPGREAVIPGGSPGGTPSTLNGAGGGSSGPNNGVPPITVLRYGSRPPGSSVTAAAPYTGPKPEQTLPSTNHQVTPPGFGGGAGEGGGLGGGLGSVPGGGVPAGAGVGWSERANAVGAGGILSAGAVGSPDRRPNNASSSGAGSGSRNVISGLSPSNGGGGGRAGATGGGAGGIGASGLTGGFGSASGSRASGTSSRSPEDGLSSSSSSSGRLGPGDGFSESFNRASIGFTSEGGLTGSSRGSSGSGGSDFGNRGSGGFFDGAAGGVRGAGTRRRNEISAGRRLGGRLANRGGSRTIPGRGSPAGDFESGTSGRGGAFPQGLGDGRSARISNGDVTGTSPGSSASPSSYLGTAISDSPSRRAGGRAGAGARGHGGQGTNILSGRPGFGSGSRQSGSTSGFSGRGMTLTGSSSGAAVFEDGFPEGLGESSSIGNSNGALGSFNGRDGEGAVGLRGDRRSGVLSLGSGSRVGGGSNVSPRSGLSPTRSSRGSSDPGDGDSAHFVAPSSAGNFDTAAGGPARGASARAGSSVGSPVRGGLRLNAATGTGQGSNRRRQRNFISRRPSSASSGTGDGPAGDNAGNDSNGDSAGAGDSTSGSSSPGGSQLDSAVTGTGTSAGPGGALGTNARGRGGGSGTQPASHTEPAPGETSESETGQDGSNDGSAGQNSTDAGSTNNDENSPLSIPLGNGPLGLEIPRLFPVRRTGHGPDPAVAAAVALGALAGVAAVGALGVGIAAAVNANRRRTKVRPGARRGVAGRRQKPGISRGGRQRRSVPESKVPAEILDQIPMNFERLY